MIQRCSYSEKGVIDALGFARHINGDVAKSLLVCVARGKKCLVGLGGIETSPIPQRMLRRHARWATEGASGSHSRHLIQFSFDGAVPPILDDTGLQCGESIVL